MKPAVTAILGLCLAASAHPAFADAPLLRPTRDVDITYHATAPGPMQDRAPDNKRLEQRVRWQAASQTMRIDPPSPGVFVIIDYVARHMSMVREADRSVVDMAAPDDMTGVAGNPATGSYVRGGEDTVAGLPCTVWQTRGRDGRPVALCITTDGVMLRADVDGHTLVTAISVQYAPQDPAVFRVPPEYAHHAAGTAR